MTLAGSDIRFSFLEIFLFCFSYLFGLVKCLLLNSFKGYCVDYGSYAFRQGYIYLGVLLLLFSFLKC